MATAQHYTDTRICWCLPEYWVSDDDDGQHIIVHTDAEPPEQADTNGNYSR